MRMDGLDPFPRQDLGGNTLVLWLLALLLGSLVHFVHHVEVLR